MKIEGGSLRFWALALSAIIVVVTFVESNEPVFLMNTRVQAAAVQLTSDQAAVGQIPILQQRERELQTQIASLDVGPSAEAHFLKYLNDVGLKHRVVVSDLHIAVVPMPSSRPGASAKGGAGGFPPPVANLRAPAQTGTTKQDLAALQGLLPKEPSGTNSPGAPVAATLAQESIQFDIAGAYRDVLYTIADLSMGNTLFRLDTPPSMKSDAAGVSAVVSGILLGGGAAPLPASTAVPAGGSHA